MIIDTSAVISILKHESDAFDINRALIDSATSCLMSAASYLEAGIVADSERNPGVGPRLDSFIEQENIIIAPVTEAQASIARTAYRKYGKGSGHKAQLNFGDCFAYALAKDMNQPLLFKGNDFSQTDVDVALA
jgi:ribonuclease VapC